MAAASMAGGKGGGGMPGGMGPIDMAAKSGLGDDLSKKTFQGITFGATGSATDKTADTIQMGLLILGAVAAFKVFKG